MGTVFRLLLRSRKTWVAIVALTLNAIIILVGMWRHMDEKMILALAGSVILSASKLIDGIATEGSRPATPEGDQ